MLNEAQEIYFSNVEMREAFLEVDGLNIQEETETYFEVIDNYELHGRTIRFHKENFEVTADLIGTFGENIDEFDVFNCLGLLPKIIFMNVKKIYFLKSAGHTAVIQEMFPDMSSIEYDFGLFSKQDGVIAINVALHENQLEYALKEKMSKKEVQDYEMLLKESVWSTLVYHLYRSMQSNPLLRGGIDESEEEAKRFCEELFRKEESLEEGREFPVVLDLDAMGMK